MIALLTSIYLQKSGKWILLCIFLIVCSCNATENKHTVNPQKPDSVLFFEYLDAGNTYYASKLSYKSLSLSLKYFDSAQMIADKSNDTFYMAEAYWAKGRIYDAWNKDPQKTIEYYNKAADLYSRLPDDGIRYLYIKHLVAHAYDKVKDSSSAVKVLQEIYLEIKSQDTSFQKMCLFTPEMALISTEVGNYILADRILKDLTSRAWIINDSLSYDYLNHYYLTQSRLDVFWRKPFHSFYLDSLQFVYNSTENVFDKMYYSHALAKLYSASGNYKSAFIFLNTSATLNDSLGNRGAVEDMQSALLRSELAAEKTKVEYQETIRVNRVRVIWLLSILLGIITILTFYLYKNLNKYLDQSKRLSSVNCELDDKVEQVELLNKEIQHRVKNNLHMIYSLLQMQERTTENEETIMHLQAARLRVENIAALHSQLQLSKSKVDFGNYLQVLISSVVNCLSDHKNVVSHIDAVEIEIADNSYFPLSLILNEWVTNSIKYASTENNSIELNISIQNEDNLVVVEYYDNGRISTDGQLIKPGLGTQIISLLSRQLGATLHSTTINPFHYKLYIPNGSKN